MLIYKIADIVFGAKIKYPFTASVCEKYLYSGDEKPEFVAEITQKEIDYEKSVSGDLTFPEPYVESLALFRALCNHALSHRNGIVFHCSAIMVDCGAYLFTAPSGTGKSTHARLWCEMLKDRAVMINDDKPIIRYIDGEFYVYGTPWNGKHRLDNNVRAPIKAICKIYQSKENVIEKASVKEMLFTVFNQTIRPTDEADMDKLFDIIDKMLKQTPLYKLGCNVSREAAETSYKAMVEGVIDEN